MSFPKPVFEANRPHRAQRVQVRDTTATLTRPRREGSRNQARAILADPLDRPQGDRRPFLVAVRLEIRARLPATALLQSTGVFVLPEADEAALRQLYDAGCSGQALELWRSEEQHGRQVVERLGIVCLVRVVRHEFVVPTFAAAIQLAAPEVEVAHRIFCALRDEARRVGGGSVALAELQRLTGVNEQQLSRALVVLPTIPGEIMRVHGPGGVRFRHLRDETPANTDAGLPLTRELKRWEGRLPESALPQTPILLQLPTMYLYGVREFRWVSTGPAAIAPALDLRGVTISDSNLAMAGLVGARFDEARIERTSFLGADLTEASFERATLRDVVFGRPPAPSAQLRRARLDHALLERVDMIGVGLADASLRSATLRRVDFGPHDVAGAELDSLRFEDNCGFDIDALVGAAKWSVIYIDGRPVYPTGPDPLVLVRRALGWAVIVRGVDRGATDRKGPAGLAVLTENPEHEFHVLDLERAELGEAIRPPEKATDSTLDGLLRAANFVALADAKKYPRLDDVGRARLAALLRYLMLLQQNPGDAAGEINEIRDHILAEVGEGECKRFLCAGPVEKMRKRAVGRLRSTLSAIAGDDGALANGLAEAFDLHEFCRYRPGPLLDIRFGAAGERGTDTSE